MNLSNDRFFRNELTMLIDGRKMPCVRYGYESHGKLYDVNVLADTFKFYAINCRGIADEIVTSVHKAIEAHFQV